MDFNQLNDLDFSNIGTWPGVAKAVLILFLCGVLAVGWYWFITLNQLDNLSRVQAKETELKTNFESKQRLAADLELHREQLVQIEEFLIDLLGQLPGSAEIAALLVDVSQTGLAAGLKFDLFRPAGEVSKSFYAELPIQVEVTGAYHESGPFRQWPRGLAPDRHRPGCRYLLPRQGCPRRLASQQAAHARHGQDLPLYRG